MLCLKMLISVSQLCRDNNVSILFSHNSFYVKDLKTRECLLEGQSKSGIYEVSSQPPRVYASTTTNSLQWHHRFGHPSQNVFRQLISKNNLNVSRISTLDCNSCACNKIRRLPFNSSSISSSSPLEYVYTDLWSSPIHSHDGFKYYIIFVDHFTKYIWLYPLQLKFDTTKVFIRYKALVENFFQLSLKTLYFDNGGEYQSLHNYLSIDGISHLTSSAHTSRHNGYSERRHRHIVETFLTLLTHAHMPLKY